MCLESVEARGREEVGGHENKEEEGNGFIRNVNRARRFLTRGVRVWVSFGYGGPDPKLGDCTSETGGMGRHTHSKTKRGKGWCRQTGPPAALSALSTLSSCFPPPPLSAPFISGSASSVEHARRFQLPSRF